MAAVSAARAAYLAGFTATSNLEAVHRYGIPGTGTAAHAWTLLHINDDGTPNEEAAFRSQVETHGTDTTLLVDTYDITQGVKTAIEVAGTELGAVRIDSGDLGVMTRKVRQQLDELGAYNTQIIVSSDLDEVRHSRAAGRSGGRVWCGHLRGDRFRRTNSFHGVQACGGGWVPRRKAIAQ